MKKLILTIVLILTLGIGTYSQCIIKGDITIPPSKFEFIAADTVAYFGFVEPVYGNTGYTSCIILKIDLNDGSLLAAGGNALTFNYDWSARTSLSYLPIGRGSVDFSAEDLLFLYDIAAKGYDANLDLFKVSNQTPAEMKYTSPENITSGFEDEVAATYRYVFDLTNSGYEKAGQQYKMYCGTADDQIVMTAWISNNSDADASADTDWIDVSTTVLGAGNITAVNSTATGFKWWNSVTPAARGMLKFVVTYGGGGSPDNSIDIYLNRTN